MAVTKRMDADLIDSSSLRAWRYSVLVGSTLVPLVFSLWPFMFLLVSSILWAEDSEGEVSCTSSVISSILKPVKKTQKVLKKEMIT